jgi:NAD(P)-dependent dehydrogenase (short-subunit alcohol dehydrogenase family)
MKRPAEVDMKGKVCVVTGANQGIGKETAVALARMGADLLIVCRSKDKGEAAVAEIKSLGKSDTVRLFVADLSSIAEVRRVAGEIRAATKRLDVLINNAGAMHSERKLTPDGFELNFGGNHLQYFVLVEELLPLLKASSPSRIVNVASDAHLQQKLDFDDLQGEKSWSAISAYGRSKLANIMFTYELSRRLEGTGVTANCLHPGVVQTGFGKKDGGIFKLVISMVGPFLRSPDKGAWTSIHLATAPELAKVSGKYFADMREKQSNTYSQDVAAQKRLWEVSEKLVATKAAAAAA